MPDILSQLINAKAQMKMQEADTEARTLQIVLNSYLKGEADKATGQYAYQKLLKMLPKKYKESFVEFGKAKGLEEAPQPPPLPSQPKGMAPPKSQSELSAPPSQAPEMEGGILPAGSLPPPPGAAPFPSAPAPSPVERAGALSGQGFGGPSPAPTPAPSFSPPLNLTTGDERAAMMAPGLKLQAQIKSDADLKSGQDRWQAFISNPENAAEYVKAEPNIKMALRAEVMFPQTNLGSMAMGGAVNMPGTIAGDDPSIQQFSPDPTKNYHATRDRAGNIIGIFAASYAPMYRMGKPVRDEVSGEWTYPMVSSRTGQPANSVGMAPPTGTWTRTSTGQKEQIIEMEDPDNPGQLIKAKVILGSTTTSVPKPTATPSGVPTQRGLPAPPSSNAAPTPMGKAPSQVRRGQENPLTASAQNIIIQSKPTAKLVRKAQQYIKAQGWDKDPTPMTTFLPRLSYAMGFGTDQGAFLGALNMDQIISAGSVLRTSGGVRAVQSLNMAMVHTPDAWKDSGKLMYDKLGAIADRLDIIEKVAREEGQRYPGLKRGEQPNSQGGSGVTPPPGAIKYQRVEGGKTKETDLLPTEVDAYVRKYPNATKVQ